MTRLQKIGPESLTPEQKRLYNEITQGPRAKGPQHFALTAEDGSLNGPFNAFLLAPELGRSLQALGAAIRYETSLTAREREIAILMVAARWDCAFERHAHESVGRAAGLTESEIESLRQRETPQFLHPREQVISELTRLLMDGDIPDEQWTGFVEPLGDATLFELSTLVGYYATLALQLRIFRIKVT